jgi:hypothetical protein
VATSWATPDGRPEGQPAGAPSLRSAVGKQRAQMPPLGEGWGSTPARCHPSPLQPAQGVGELEAFTPR